MTVSKGFLEEFLLVSGTTTTALWLYRDLLQWLQIVSLQITIEGIPVQVFGDVMYSSEWINCLDFWFHQTCADNYHQCANESKNYIYFWHSAGYHRKVVLTWIWFSGQYIYIYYEKSLYIERKFNKIMIQWTMGFQTKKGRTFPLPNAVAGTICPWASGRFQHELPSCAQPNKVGAITLD